MKQLLLLCTVFIAFIAVNSLAEETQVSNPITLTLGAKVHSGEWKGENEDNDENNIKSDKGGGIGLSLGLRKGRWFGVFNVQGGGYDFNEEQPVYDPDPDLINDDDITIKTSFVSLGFGYQFSRYFALQAGIKSHKQEWEDHNVELNYVGTGIGATGFIPLSNNWTLYGTVGLNKMTIEDKNGNEVGDGTSNSVELGAAYRISSLSSISFGMKNEEVKSEFDSGRDQTHNLTNFYFGYNHGFRF